jgi:hypothetical protein
VKLAFPAPSKLVEANLVEPSLNKIVPDGVPPPEELTLAWNVTDCPKLDGFKVELRVTELGSFTLSEMLALLLPQFTSLE